MRIGYEIIYAEGGCHGNSHPPNIVACCCGTQHSPQHKLSSLVMLPYLYSRFTLIPTTSRNVARRFFTFEAGDFCMLREMRSNRKYLIGPLEEGMQKDHKGGRINHEDLMGKPIRSIVRTHNGKGLSLYLYRASHSSREMPW